MNNKVSVVCIGSRERYSMPKSLCDNSRLGKLYTDIYFPGFISSFARILNLKGGLLALFQRNCHSISSKKVWSSNYHGIIFRKRIRSLSNLEKRQECLLEFTKSLFKGIDFREDDSNCIIFYNGCGKELILKAKALGKKVIVNQVDPGLLEWQCIKNETEKYGYLLNSSTDYDWSKIFQENVFEELNAADLVIVNSEYSKAALRYWNVATPIEVLPISYTLPLKRKQYVKKDKLKFFFLGQVSLRKGIQYILPALDRLFNEGYSFELLIAGELFIKKSELLRPYIKFFGALPTNKVIDLFGKVDVMLFPTISDGFGMAQLESLSQSVPVIASKNCASIVQDSQNGFLLESLDQESLYKACKKYLTEDGLIEAHISNCHNTIHNFDENRYYRNLSKIVGILN